MRKFLGFLLVFVLASCQSLPKAPLPSSYLSGNQTLSFHDTQRQKSLAVWVWYPVAEDAAWKTPANVYPWGRLAEQGAPRQASQARPLLLLSHGFAGSPEEYAWLVEPLVAAGYVVLATKHSDLPGPQMNHWNRALDVSFVLSEFLKTPIGLSIDLKRIGFMGFSLGGMTGISLAGAKVTNLSGLIPDTSHVREARIIQDAREARPHLDSEKMQSDLHDDRIKAAFLMAPAWAWAFEASQLKGVSIPVSIVAGDKDEVLVSETNGLWYAQHIPKAQFQWIQGAGHFVFLGTPSCEGRKTMDPNGSLSFLYKDEPSVNRAYVQEQVKNLAMAFFASHL